MILTAYGLLLRKPDPSEAEIFRAALMGSFSSRLRATPVQYSFSPFVFSLYTFLISRLLSLYICLSRKNGLTPDSFTIAWAAGDATRHLSRSLSLLFSPDSSLK